MLAFMSSMAQAQRLQCSLHTCVQVSTYHYDIKQLQHADDDFSGSSVVEQATEHSDPADQYHKLYLASASLQHINLTSGRTTGAAVLIAGWQESATLMVCPKVACAPLRRAGTCAAPCL